MKKSLKFQTLFLFGVIIASIVFASVMMIWNMNRISSLHTLTSNARNSNAATLDSARAYSAWLQNLSMYIYDDQVFTNLEPNTEVLNEWTAQNKLDNIEDDTVSSALREILEPHDEIVETAKQILSLMPQNKEQAIQMFENTIKPDVEFVIEKLMLISDRYREIGDTYSQNLQGIIQQITIIMSVIFIVLILLSILMSYSLIRVTVSPILAITNAAKQLSDGNLSYRLSLDSKNEIEILANSLNTASEHLQSYVVEISRMMKHMADGNFDTSFEVHTVGDFAEIEYAMVQYIAEITHTLSKINTASQCVLDSSYQVSKDAKTLAHGSVEQAGSLEKLSAGIDQLTLQVNHNAEHAVAASQKAEHAGQEIENSNQQMKQMMDAMEMISQKSDEISKIIKTIDDIAFQTNILALNAAVEAARAGTAGKGFSVVADEVRNLANKSAEAAQSTSNLIEDTIAAVKHGKQIATSTAKTLDTSVIVAKDAVALIDEIALSSKEQANSIQQLGVSMEQIASVVHTNSAASQQSAATSEELRSQANMLRHLVSKFKLNLENVTFMQENQLVTGNDIIDNQHMVLFEAVRNITTLDAATADAKTLTQTLGFLSSYVNKHFSDEEQIQLESNYPEYERHKSLHETFKKEVFELEQKLNQQKVDSEILNRLSSLVRDWLVQHIQREDVKVANYVRRYQQNKKNHSFL